MSIPLENSNLNVAEQVNVLFKASMGFPSTKETLPWFAETAVKYNNYINGEDILLDVIPDSLSWNDYKLPSEVGLEDSNFATGGYVRDDTTGTIREYKRVILNATPNSGDNSYYLLNSDGNNILADGLQFNTKWSGVGDKLYPYVLNTVSYIQQNSNTPEELLQDSTGGNWLYDIKNGVLFFPDYKPSLCNNTNNKPVFSFFKYIGRKGISNLGSGGSGGGNGIDISGGSTSSDISMNFTGTRNEGDIVYDSNRNIFLEASRSKDNENSEYTQDELDFKPLGYSFFRENLEGQPPSPLFFFFDITPSSITINWTNPRQYPSGVSNLSDSYNDTANGELSATVNSNGNIFFPVVNRIMIQIKNLETELYEQWGTERSPISQNVEGLTGGYVICSKNHPIPPMKTSISPYFGTRHSIGRNKKVYELIDMANSIVLYSVGNTPITEPVIKNNINSNPKRVSAINGEPNKEINPSTDGYEIKIWLENQYNKTGGMTENDFNVMTLTKDNNNDILNFQTVSPPTEPIDVDFNLAFNDLSSKNVGNGNTVIELIVKDPKQTTSSGDFNTTINLVGVKLEYANTDSNSPSEEDWSDVKKIYFEDESQITSNSNLGTLTRITDGIHNINRLNKHEAITDDDTDTKYYYYIKLNSEFLSVTNNQFKRYHSFRISYKNASNDNFGTTTISNVVSVKEPEKPSIESVKMTSYNTITISMNTYGTDKEDLILGETLDTNINKNYAVFLREAMFKVMYKYDDQSNFTEIESFTVSGSNNNNSTGNTDSAYVTTESYELNSYNYTIPAGYLIESNTNSFKYKFQVKYRNNLFNNNFSEFSDPVEIEFTKPDQSSDNISFTILDLTTNKNNNNTLKVSWSHPSNGQRGVVSTQASNGLPKIQKYTFKSTNLKDNDNDTAVDHGDTSINSSSRSIDPFITKEFTFYDALKYDGSKNKVLDLDIEIKEYNEYVNNSSTFSSNITLESTKPDEATGLTTENEGIDTINLSITTTNDVTIYWEHPSYRGLKLIGNNEINKNNTIIQYDISINRATTNKYLSGKIKAGSFTTTNYTTTITNGDNSSDKISTTDAATSLSLPSTLSDMFLWPNSTYTYEIKTTNSLEYQTDGVSNSFTTQVPSIPSGLGYFNDSRLGSLSSGKRTDLKGHSNYANKGVLVNADITSSTTYSGTAVQITKLYANSKPTDITSNEIYHILNKTNLQDNNWGISNDTVVSWTDDNPPDNSNQAQFKIWNIAPSSDVEVYTIGTSDNFSEDSGDNKESTRGITFVITRDDRKDAYKYNSNYDNRNYGYWYTEGVKYTITFTNPTSTADLYTPLKYELRSYYNTTGGGDVSSTANDSTVILQNTNNTDGYIYFDNSCTSDPTIEKLNDAPYINYTVNNYINGIPNLRPIDGSKYNKISFTYKAGGYSKRYLLTSSENLFYYKFTNTNSNGILGQRDWGDFGEAAPSGVFVRNQNDWNVSGHEFNLTSTASSSRTDIGVQIYATNTHGTKNIIVSDGVYKFIYDKNSVDYYNSIKDSLIEIPGSFNPIYEDSSAQLPTTPSSYSAIGNNVNNLQLPIWNGYFYSRNGWQTATSINTTNCANYGMSSSDPIFSGGDSHYKYVIFKYEFTPSSTFSPYKVILSLGNSNNFDVSDLNDNVKIFIYTSDSITGADGNSYYWLNMSRYSDITDAAASGGAVVYSGGVADSSYETMTNSNFKSSSDINGSGKFTNNFSGTVPKRIIGARINKITISANTTKSIYIAIGCKNLDSLYLKKPDLYLASGSNSFETEQFL